MTFAIHNLGCKVNTYETDAMICSLKEAGFEERAFDETADIYIINTFNNFFIVFKTGIFFR